MAESAAEAMAGPCLATCSGAYWSAYARGFGDGCLRGYELHRAETEADDDAMWAEAVRRVHAVAKSPSYSTLCERRGEADRAERGARAPAGTGVVTGFEGGDLHDFLATGPPDEEPLVPSAWTAASTGEMVLGETFAFLGRFVAFPSDAAHVAVTLWAAHCHAVAAFDSSPRLALLSPEPGSGKTRTLEVLGLLVPRPMHVLNASVAVTFRAVDAEQPTLLLDEVDALFGRRTADEHEELRGLLNAGHRKGATVPRCVGPNHELKKFNVYAACALAGLGDLPDTLMSRSVIIRMRRRAPGEVVEPFRQRLHEPVGHDIGERLAAWVAQVADALGIAWPTMPPGVEDRPADCWEPLLAVADAAGGDWPARARAACTELVRVAASGEASLGVRLLGDLRMVFGGIDAMHTETILTGLHGLDEAPWADLRGKPLDSRRLARLLGNYGVHSVDVKLDGKNLKGYRRESLHDTWTRYLPGLRTSATSATSTGNPPVTSANAVADEADRGSDPSATRYPSATSDGPLTSEVTQVAQVALSEEPAPTCPHCGTGTTPAATDCGWCHAPIGAGDDLDVAARLVIDQLGATVLQQTDERTGR